MQTCTHSRQRTLTVYTKTFDLKITKKKFFLKILTQNDVFKSKAIRIRNFFIKIRIWT